MIGPFKRIDRKVFFLLLAAGLLGVVAVLPFMMDLLPSLAVEQAARPELSMPLIVALAMLQNGILLAAAIAAGMLLAERIGLRMPLVDAWVRGEHPAEVKTVVAPGVLVGAAVGVVMVGVDALFFVRHLPAAMLAPFEIPLWKRLLAGVVYGGITEELLMRLFLLSLVAWLVGRWWRTAAGKPAPGAFWMAISVVAVLFGLGHLPATAALTPLTPELVVRALALNGVAGVAFGYLCWRHGLESAMAGHMSAHLVMQLPGVMLLKSLL